MAIAPRLAESYRRGSLPLPQRQGESPLAGVGDVLGALADADRRDRQADRQVRRIDDGIAEREQEDARAAAVARNGARLATLQGALRQRIAGLRAGAAEGAPGHQAAVRAELDRFSREFWPEVGADPEVARRFQEPLAQIAASIEVGEDEWARGQAATAQGAQIEQLLGAGEAAVLADPKAAQAQLDAVLGVVEAMPVKQPSERAAIRALVEQRFARATADGVENAGDAATLRQLAADPTFAARHGDADGLLDRAGRLEAAAQAAAEAEAADRRDAAKEALDAAEADMAGGGIVRDPGALAAQARALGVDEAEVIRFETQARNQGLARRFGPAADPDGRLTRARMAQLSAAAQGRALTAEENREFTYLDGLRERRQVDAAAPLRARLGGDARSHLAVLAEIDRAPATERFAVAEKVRAGLGYFGALPPAMRDDALEGYFDLKANPELIRVGENGQRPKDVTGGAFRRHLGAMAGELPDATINAYRTVAEGLYARMLKDAGRAGTWQPELFARAANMAMGARQDRDGTWRGGMGLVNDRHVLLPDWSTADGLERLLARADWSRARYGNGERADPRDVARHYTPVLESGGGRGEAAVYTFVNAEGQELKDAAGAPFRQVALPPKAR